MMTIEELKRLALLIELGLSKQGLTLEQFDELAKLETKFKKQNNDRCKR
jgi:hypothetical protein